MRVEINEIEKKKQRKHNKTKSLSVENSDKFDKSVTGRLSKRDRTQIAKLRNERRDINTNLAEIKEFTSKNQKQWHGNKLQIKWTNSLKGNCY